MLRQNSPTKSRGLKHAGTDNPCYPLCLNGLADVIKRQKNKNIQNKNTVFDLGI